MNNVVLSGRLTADPDVRYGNDGKPIAKYTLAVDKKFKREGQPTADFIPCITFGKNAEFVEKYLTKGIKIMVVGEIQTANFKNQDDKMIYTWNVVVSTHEFCESKKSQEENRQVHESTQEESGGGFMNVPEGIAEDELPFM